MFGRNIDTIDTCKLLISSTLSTSNWGQGLPKWYWTTCQHGINILTKKKIKVIVDCKNISYETFCFPRHFCFDNFSNKRKVLPALPRMKPRSCLRPVCTGNPSHSKVFLFFDSSECLHSWANTYYRSSSNTSPRLLLN